MHYHTIAPPADLARYVRFFWVLEGEAGTEPYVHRSMADGCPEIIFHYRGVFDELLPSDSIVSSFRSGIHGQAQKFSRFIIHRGSFGILGAYLYPFAIPALFSMPATEITNQAVDFAALLGQQGKDLEEQIFSAAGTEERVDMLSRFLRQKLNTHRQHPVLFSVGHVIQTQGVVNIVQLADRYSLSTRQFERKFKELSGFSPKLYSRIIRFQATLARYQATGVSLTDIAYNCGYYDQSHFIHDFKEFSGHHPWNYFSGKAEGTEWRD